MTFSKDKASIDLAYTPFECKYTIGQKGRIYGFDRRVEETHTLPQNTKLTKLRRNKKGETTQRR